MYSFDKTGMEDAFKGEWTGIFDGCFASAPEDEDAPMDGGAMEGALAGALAAFDGVSFILNFNLVCRAVRNIQCIFFAYFTLICMKRIFHVYLHISMQNKKTSSKMPQLRLFLKEIIKK